MREDHHSFEEEIIIEEGGEKYNNSPFEQSQHEAERGGDEEDFIEGQNRSLENKRSSNQPNNKNKLQNTIARQGKKAGRALVKKGAQKLKKLAVKAVVKLGALAIKALGALIAWVGLPMVLLFGFLIVVTVVGMMISTSIVGTGEAAEEFGAEAQALNEYVKELSQSTIDQSKPEQFVYRVPEELLAAVVQMDSLTKDFEEKGKADPLHDYKKILKIFADKLKPQFEYETYTEVTETRTRSCDENGENCSWSTSKTTRKVTQLVGVTAWNGNMSADYEKQTTGWSGGNPQTKETYYVQKNYQHQYDYSMLDAILNSQGYNEEDKKIFEMLYEYATGTPMYYIAWLNGHDISFEDGCYSIDGNIIPGAGVPPQFMPHYLSASQKYGVPWEYLAAIHRVETTFSTDLNTSYAGAVGHTQFMPCTWLGWNYSGCTGTKGRGSNIPKNTLLNPSMIAKYGGYGVDANGDGKADPMQIEDAIHSTANYLKASGMPGNPKKAIRRYNHSDKYVNDVMSYAAKFRAEASTAPNPSTTTTATASKKSSLMNSFSFVSRAYANSSANYQSGWKATAYAPALGGINGGSTTASGTKVVNGRTIAVDPKLIPLGSIVAIKVPNMPKYNGVYVAEDTGGAIKNKKIDIAIAPGQVKAFGVKSIQVAILKRGSGVKDAKKTVATWSTSKAKWEQLAGVASSSSTDNGPYGVNNGTFPLPKGQYDKFGDSWGNDRTYGGDRRHEGNDIMAKSGVKIYSATDGVVEKHGWNKLGGWRLNIKSPDGYNLYYAHMLKYAPGISKGVKVKRGQLIGYVGATGYGPQGTTGKFDPHLHFGIYKNGKAINPYPFLKAWEKGEQILDDSNPYASCGTDEGGESSELGNGNATGKAADVLKAGEKWLGRPYKWGGGRTDATVAKGLFDCSGFVHYAFSQVGINLGPRNSVSTDTLKKLQKKIPASQMQPGDLVFFDTDKTDGHVGIYAGNGKFLGSQTSTGVAYADMSKGYWKNKFNGRVIRVLK